MAEKILIVEDERNIASFVVMYLKNARYQVEIARDGAEALQKAEAAKPDLVLLDLMLPDIDGLEVCRRIRAGSDVPILMLTARDDDVDKIVGLEVGADDYLTKPFNPRELVARQHEASVVEQLPEQVELLRSKLDLLVTHTRLATARIDDEVAVHDDLALTVAPLGRRPPKDRPDPRHELARVEGLGEVVVGADLEPDDLVHVLVARGQHEDGHVGVLADPLADLDAVDVREHQVEHDQRRLLRRHRGQRI